MKRLLKTFPNKNWKLDALKALIRKIDKTGTIDRRLFSGGRCTLRTTAINDQVEHLALSHEGKLQTHRTVCCMSAAS